MTGRPDQRNGTRGHRERGEGRPRTRTGGPAGHDNGGNGATRPRLPGARAVRLAREFVEEFTGREAESVSSLVRSGEGWAVTFDVVETEKIPRTTDIMGSYLVELDGGGELVRCERTGRYVRGQAAGE